MNPGKDKSEFFRFTFLILLIGFVVVALLSLTRYTSSPTDQNVFATTPGSIYITESFPCQRLESSDEDEEPVPVPDSVRAGDILVYLEGKDYTNLRKIRSFLAKRDSSERFEMGIFRPSQSTGMGMLVYKKDLPDSVFREIPSSVYIRDIVPGGASDRAGLKVGDLIVRINDQTFKDALEADMILRFAIAGKSLSYEILRDDRTHFFDLTLATVGIQFTILIIALVGLCFIAIGAFVGLKRPQFMAARLMGLSFLMLGFAMVASPRRDVYTDTFPMIRDGMLLVAFMMVFPFLMHLSMHFPQKRPEMLSRKWILRVVYGIGIVTFLASILATGQNYQNGISNGGFLLMGLFTAVIQLVFLRKRSQEYKQIGRIINYTSAAVFVLVFGTIAALALAADGGSFQPNVTTGLALTTLVLIPLSYLYTIGRYHLMDMDLRIRRNILYTLLSGIWGGVALTGLIYLLVKLAAIDFNLPNIQFSGAFLEVLEDPLAPEDQFFAQKGFVALLGIIATAVMWRGYRYAQGWIDEKFYRSRFDFRRANREMTEVLTSQITLDGLGEGLAQKISEIMQLKFVGVVFFDNARNCVSRQAFGIPVATWQQFCDKFCPMILGLIRENPEDEHFGVDYMPEKPRLMCRTVNLRHVMIIRSKEKLLGVLMVGEKLAETPYHSDDITLLGNLGKQAAVGVENAFLYSELAEKERLRYELEIARRIQLASLPQQTPVIKGLDIAGVSIPAQEVGGDYFDYLNGRPDELTIIIGDVSGKGTSAALYMSKVQGIMRSLHDFCDTPRDLLIRTNKLLV
ncbi:MAG TPA: PDZ domain-containing protein, partial [Calditrichia bacterium]|nr:PDZ domain-containing protein [Calditrichia bacterium]